MMKKPTNLTLVLLSLIGATSLYNCNLRQKIHNLEAQITNQRHDQALIDENYRVLRTAMELATNRDGVKDIFSPEDLFYFLTDIGVRRIPLKIEPGNISYDVLPDKIKILLNGRELLGTTNRKTLLDYIERSSR